MADGTNAGKHEKTFSPHFQEQLFWKKRHATPPHGAGMSLLTVRAETVEREATKREKNKEKVTICKQLLQGMGAKA